MTQEDKELVLIDIFGRLLYNVICSTIFGDAVVLYVDTYEGTIYIPCNEWVCDFKPYLRPMEDMTREERYELQEIIGKDVEISDGSIDIIDSSRKSFSFLELQAVFNWLNKKMFDYRGLIPRGLALTAPKGMYK